MGRAININIKHDYWYLTMERELQRNKIDHRSAHFLNHIALSKTLILPESFVYNVLHKHEHQNSAIYQICQ